MIDVLNERVEVMPETALALGFFDGLHLGHAEVIKAALNKGTDGLTPAVFTFSSGSRLPKLDGNRLIVTEKQKRKLLLDMGVKYIAAPNFDDVKSLSKEDFFEKYIVNILNAKFITCGFDFRFGKGGSGNVDDIKKFSAAHSIAYKIIPPVSLNGRVISSSDIRKYIENGEIEKANFLLGYELMYELDVVHGQKLGRTLGFPTINQIFPQNNVVPRFGVYKSWTMVDGNIYNSVTNIGVKPTFKSESIPTLETHIIGFDGDIYGREIRVSLRSFLRDEMKFNNIYELKAQIQKDIDFIVI